MAHAGEVIDRDHIRQEIWKETAVDFDRSLNVAIAQIRSALNDDAASPRLSRPFRTADIGFWRRSMTVFRSRTILSNFHARRSGPGGLCYAGDLKSPVEALKPLMPQSLVSETAAFSPGDAMRRLIEFQTASAKSDSYQRAWQLAILGFRPEALTALELGFAERNPMMPLIKADPAFRIIREEPRFRSLVRRMGL